MKKLTALFMALVMMMAMATTASAAKITITDAPDDGVYKLYKIADVTSLGGGKYTYTVVAGWKDFFAAGGDGASYISEKDSVLYLKMNITDDDANAKALAVEAATWTGKPTETATATVSDAKAVFDGLETGYYLVTSSIGTAAVLINLPENGTEASKDEKNDVGALPALAKTVSDEHVAIDETVTFTVTITADTGAKEAKYAVSDEMPAQFSTPYDFVLKWNDAGTETAMAAGTDYTVTDTDNDFAITFTDTFLEKVDKEDKIIITYNTKLLATAEADKPYENVAQLTYVGGSRTATASTQTHKITVNKVDEKGTALTGAGFTLQKKNGEDWDNVDTIDATPATSTFVFEGLGDGEYKVLESTVPNGYTKAADKEVEITTESKTIDVVNVVGQVLPETGGMGTTVFYLSGAVLMMAAGVLMLSKKRRFA